MCEKSGCHIEEIASDLEATTAIDEILAARQVLDASGLQKPYHDALLSYGFDEWPTGILKLEMQYARFKQRLSESRERKTKARRKR